MAILAAGTGTTFGENLALLLFGAILAAGLTGFVAPIALQRANRLRLNDQKQYEENLRRESAFIAAQAEFLGNLATAAWEFQGTALAVSYAGAYAPGDRFDKAWETYDRESFGLLGRLSALISIAVTLFSHKIVEQLNNYYDEWLNATLDQQLSRMALSQETTQQDWQTWHNPHHASAGHETTELLAAVAHDAGLSYNVRREADLTSS